MRNVRLKDIAKKIGVSTTAVCNVLNDKPIRISKAKREEILELAEALNYKPDIIASGLKNKKTKSIGIVIPDMRTLFYPEIIRAIEKDLRKNGYNTIICNTADDPFLEKEQIENLLSRRVDALVLAPADGKENLKFFRSINKSEIPLIFIDRYYEKEQINFVATDNLNGAAKGVKELLKSNGKIKRIIYIGESKRNLPLEERLKGVKKEASDNGIRMLSNDIFLIEPEKKKMISIGNKIFEKKLKDFGIFLESNRFLSGLLAAAAEHAISIPDDVCIVGFDPVELKIDSQEDIEGIRTLKKPIPVILQNISGISRAVVAYLLKALTDKTSKNKKMQLKLPVAIS